MRNRYLDILTLGFHAVFALVCLTSSIRGADPGCAQCGCRGYHKVCRLVREDKKVTVTCWGMKCEDFCAPGRSCRGDKNCEEIYPSTDKDTGPCAAPKVFTWYDWIPGNADGIYTKKKLMKKTVTKTIPSFKWVVEDLCAECEAQTQDAVVPPGVTVPPRPQGNSNATANVREN